MHPVLIDFGFELGGLPVRLYTYGACMVVGLAMAVVTFVVRGRRHNEVLDLYLLSLVTFVAGLLGSKVLFVLVNHDYYSALPPVHVRGCTLPPVRDCLMSGMVWYGGVIAAIPAAAVYAFARGMRFLELFDAAAPALSLGHLWGRIGCFMAGCCYGSATDLPWGVSFPPASIAFVEMLDKDLLPPGSKATMPLHPTQLYEAASELVILAALLAFAPRKRSSGQVAGLYLVLYSVARFAIEFARGDLFRGSSLGLTTSQWISIVILASGVLLVSWRAFLPGRPPDRPISP